MSLIIIINFLFQFLKGLLLARILLSWFPHNRYNPIINFIYEFSDPILGPFKRAINPMGGIDFSPIIVFFILNFLQSFIIRLLISM